MSARIPELLALAVISGVLLGGCARSHAPPGWLPTADECREDAYGGWVTVEHTLVDGNVETRGELIAVMRDTVFVLTPDSLAAIPKAGVSRAVLTAYDPRHSALGGWTCGGILLTISHGFFSLLSIPVWITTGSLATADQSRRPREVYPHKSWGELAAYARFPQGLPLALDRRALTPKPPAE